MKITVEGRKDSGRPTMVFEYETDDMDIYGWIALFKVILKGWTFSEETIDSVFAKDES